MTDSAHPATGLRRAPCSWAQRTRVPHCFADPATAVDILSASPAVCPRGRRGSLAPAALS